MIQIRNFVIKMVSIKFTLYIQFTNFGISLTNTFWNFYLTIDSYSVINFYFFYKYFKT